MNSREYYGIDAPTVVRHLALLGGATAMAGVLANRFQQNTGPPLVIAGSCLSRTAAWMLVSSLWLKRAVMQSLLDEPRWHGAESVRDVGCGRGLAGCRGRQTNPKGYRSRLVAAVRSKGQSWRSSAIEG
jgi:arsenite methyltransferase